MRYLSKKSIFLYSFILLFLVGRVFVFKILPISKYTYLINPLFWIFMSILSYLLSRNESSFRTRSKYDIVQSIIIVMIIYCMAYFSLGLLFGYEKSPYSHSFVVMLKNLWAFVVIIFFQEFTRYQLLKLSTRKLWDYGLITLFFIVANIDFWSFLSNFSNNADFFKYLSQTLLPLIVTNCLFTYLVITSNYVASTIYRGIIELIVILLPIFPSVNWLLKSLIDIILVVIVALYINYIDIKSSRLLNRRELKKESVISYVPFVIILVVMVCFIGGMFKFQPIAVLSNSMHPTFSRGDAIIVNKIKKDEFYKLKKGTILYFSKDGNLVVHRIVSVMKNEHGKLEIITKGDNNNSNDNWIVTDEEIIGTVKFMIPYVGYPSVIVNDLLKK